MPRTIRVPALHHAALRRLASLDDVDWTSLIDSLSSLKGIKAPDDLVEAIPESFGTESRYLVAAIIGLENVRSIHSLGRPEAVGEVSETTELLESDDQREILQQRLLSLLTLPAVLGASKVSSISREYDSLFHTAMVVSDIRPIFGDEITTDPIGALISSTLVIETWTENDYKTVRISMDESDIVALSETLTRAQTKLLSLRTWLLKADVHEVLRKGGNP